MIYNNFNIKGRTTPKVSRKEIDHSHFNDLNY